MIECADSDLSDRVFAGAMSENRVEDLEGLEGVRDCVWHISVVPHALYGDDEELKHLIVRLKRRATNEISDDATQIASAR